ncbi:class I SAM-dependent methyltransferase (plasmid) [Bradyrhizobium sp. ISRA443]|uniref:class I SAM-dependent DNA methyltransferase n=1 Tax=unclassified Bradyrhizobium TaxID=2631580 RepID=UPI00247A3586|nr:MULTISPECIES: class I SAM-dependent methyltransferase [unclassified Bradyrhizobium]WGS03080.1 class I SAM-dependent methyltransferase [Bradyrhizobium sp. ISRA436]WGS09886.1 class I SAM-dependent methyltransferase [Bradyrhizobium sp. ISRA437]WGS16771.1 class I SAM-dependent methyltransferase [Bradyrhizobium sp. ISRA443]
MNAFEHAADYYDILYEDKDYAAEGDYIDRLIRQHFPEARSLLDLGCGTGRHAIRFAEKGYSVTGIDRNSSMIARAEGRRQTLASPARDRLVFERCDLRDLSLGRSFDAVVALFHVVSYQTSNDDLMAAFATANAHTRPGGLFIFDCWYGPGVLGDPPAVRIKRVYDEQQQPVLIRIAEPTMRINQNIVDVQYHFMNRDKNTGIYSEFYETHAMRYFFVPELFLALETVGFTPVVVAESMTNREPVWGTWNVSVVARKPD